MNSGNTKAFRMFAALVMLFLCMTAANAWAMNATEVLVESELLDSNNPYWKNTGTATADDWNVYFDTTTETPTLWLKDADIDELNFDVSLLAVDGDVIIKLLGDNTLSYSGSVEGDVAGISAYGELTIMDGTEDGTGTLTIMVEHTVTNDLYCTDGIYVDYDNLTIESGTINITVSDPYEVDCIAVYNDITINGGQLTLAAKTLSAYEYTEAIAYGIYGNNNLYINGGQINLIVEAITAIDNSYTVGLGFLVSNDLYINDGQVNVSVYAENQFMDFSIAYGFDVFENIYINGGETVVEATADGVCTVFVDGFTMTDGTFTATANGVLDDSTAISFLELMMTGGTAKFYALSNGYGGMWDGADNYSFRVIDGLLVFSSTGDAALFFETESTVTPYVDGRTFVSVNATGEGIATWGVADGNLADTNLVSSDYQYVHFLGGGIEVPMTGDQSKPWTWLLVAAAALIAGSGMLILLKKKNKG